ncbi:2-oxoglutarate synthase [Candidatus Pacearchaeota archaeon]|nr:2-oxoglutarate synthase [Candidatus Pacearchaeota archaeon]|tara:strand:+ start:2248 stop:3102 length:855 start_codon:yes stop_codon:yes gene_type:complete
MKIKDKLSTREEVTWCPGCPNFMILESVKKAISEMSDKGGYSLKDFVMTTDIGCHAKMFDYLNLSGVYCLHGRALPTAEGVCIGNPKMHVLAFVGDGAIYAEGIGHLPHAFRNNMNMTLVVHDNQSYSLTTGQSTPTSQQGFKTKVKPQGEENKPLNPILFALASGATFIARCNAKNINHTADVLMKAIAHKGFSFVEIVQDCLIFNLEMNNKDSRMYEVVDNRNLDVAFTLAKEFDYNSKRGRIPLGVLYQNRNAKTFAQKWPQIGKVVGKGGFYKGQVKGRK